MLLGDHRVDVLHDDDARREPPGDAEQPVDRRLARPEVVLEVFHHQAGPLDHVEQRLDRVRLPVARVTEQQHSTPPGQASLLVQLLLVEERRGVLHQLVDEPLRHDQVVERRLGDVLAQTRATDASAFREDQDTVQVVVLEPADGFEERLGDIPRVGDDVAKVVDVLDPDAHHVEAVSVPHDVEQPSVEPRHDLLRVTVPLGVDLAVRPLVRECYGLSRPDEPVDVEVVVNRLEDELTGKLVGDLLAHAVRQSERAAGQRFTDEPGE